MEDERTIRTDLDKSMAGTVNLYINKDQWNEVRAYVADGFDEE